jgi:hypothetical protein
MKRVLFLFLISIVMLTVTVYAQPVIPFDLRADNVSVSFNPSSLTVTATGTFINAMPVTVSENIDIVFRLDSSPVNFTSNLLEALPEQCMESSCFGNCDMGFGGSTIIGQCHIWQETCSCQGIYQINLEIPYAGEQWLEFELDPLDTVLEDNEFNNKITVDLFTVPAELTTWGVIKAL